LAKGEAASWKTSLKLVARFGVKRNGKKGKKRKFLTQDFILGGTSHPFKIEEGGGKSRHIQRHTSTGSGVKKSYLVERDPNVEGGAQLIKAEGKEKLRSFP